MEHSYSTRYRSQVDEEIPESNGAGPSSLDAQLRVYHAKALRAQTRLSEALDTIDEMERRHAEQLALNERREGKLKQKMRAYADMAKKAEEETEDMRQAVITLIEKVEKGNGYKSLKPSQIHVSSLLDPLTPPRSQRNPPADSEELLAYAATMLDVARRERTLERRAHQKTKEWAQSRISALEAQLSRREAELARCATHCVPARTQSPIPHPPPSYPEHETESIPYMDTLQWTISKNRTLEKEIQALSEKLAGARMQGSTPKARVESPARKPKALEELGEQVQQLGKLVDALQEDKAKWRSVLDAEKVRHPSESLSQRLSAVEAECAMLRQSEEELRRRLETTERQEHVRESVLKQRIELLDSQLAALVKAPHFDEPTAPRSDTHTSETPPIPNDSDTATIRVTKRQKLYTSPPPPPPQQPFPQPFAIPTREHEDLLGDDGEVSMDLATPLIPTTILVDEQEPIGQLPDSPNPQPQLLLEPPSPFELSPYDAAGMARPLSSLS